MEQPGSSSVNTHIAKNQLVSSIRTAAVQQKTALDVNLEAGLALPENLTLVKDTNTRILPFVNRRFIALGRIHTKVSGLPAPEGGVRTKARVKPGTRVGSGLVPTEPNRSDAERRKSDQTPNERRCGHGKLARDH